MNKRIFLNHNRFAHQNQLKGMERFWKPQIFNELQAEGTMWFCILINQETNLSIARFENDRNFSIVIEYSNSLILKTVVDQNV